MMRVPRFQGSNPGQGRLFATASLSSMAAALDDVAGFGV